MKRFSVVVLAMIFACSMITCSAGEKKEARKELVTDLDKTGYAIGTDIGASIKVAKADFDTDALIQGLKDALSDTEFALTEEELATLRQQFSGKMQQARMTEMQGQSEKNRKEGEMFLAENAKREGVITTESGLQYEVIKEGEGSKPAAEDTVTVHYKGTLIDGTTFDSSIERGEPATFPLNMVIRGWTEGVQLMSVGSKFKFYIPSELGYGDRGAPPRIGPGAALIFEVELLGIEGK